jgi:hypothetical protein
MRAWLVFAVIATTAVARGDERVFVPSVAAGIAFGGSSLAAPADLDAYTAASLAWESRARSRISIVPTFGVFGVWHSTPSPLALAGGRVDVAVSPVLLSAGVHAGIADDTGGIHPAWEAAVAARTGERVRIGVELAITGWRATMMMGADPMPASMTFGRLGLSLAIDL